MQLKPYSVQLMPRITQEGIDHLNEKQLNDLTEQFQLYYDKAPAKYAKARGRYFLVFLFLRYTGSRISEVIGIDDQVDVDFRAGDITMAVLKRHNPKRKNARKIVAVPLQAVNELARYLAQFPAMRSKAFAINRSNFFRIFEKRCSLAGIPEDLAHPHVLRHTRALELVRAGVPLTIVQQILGHSNLNTTAIYLNFSGQESKQILKDRGLL
jgi:integrase